MNEKNEKVGGKMIRRKKVLAITITLLILVLGVGGVLGYMIYTGRLNFNADTGSTVISNTVYGTYTSDLGSGNVTSNEVQVQVAP